MKNTDRKISVLVPAYNEQESLVELHDQIVDSFNNMKAKGQVGEYEIWFINDGSSDDTESVIESIIEKDNNSHLISFRKNFGKSPALEAGFHHVTGDLIFTIDADLQDDPAEFSRFVEKIDEGYDMVVGWKYNRLDPLEKKLPSKLFNAVTSKASGIKLHDFDCGFKCFVREVADAIDVYGEYHRYIPVLAHRKGFKITEITVNHRKREHGHSKYGMERYLRGLFDSLSTTFILKYHDRPMYLFGKFGVLSSVLGFLFCLILTFEKLIASKPIGNRPLLYLGILLIIVGVQFLSIGFVCNLIIDKSFRNNYQESHIKKIL